MEKRLAELVVENLKSKKGIELTVLEAMSMTKIMSDNLEVYAIQKCNTTILAWVVDKTDTTYVDTKTICW